MYRKQTHIHFVGIGGIGMSGIAKILKKLGYIISGCDIDVHQKSIYELQQLSCHIFQGNNTINCKDPSVDILVYSSAIQQNNPEIIAAQERGIPTIARALMLAELLRTKYSILISGSHGKTTTTSMIAHLLIEAKKDPTVAVGGHIKNISTNARLGSGEFFVAEADESDKSLTRLSPTLAVVTNIDLEHLDVYRDMTDIQEIFCQFLSNVPFYGKAFVCADDLYIREILPRLPHIKAIKYGIETEADYQATHIQLQPSSTFFIARIKSTQEEVEIQVPMPGKHNVLNSLAAIAVAQEVAIPMTTIQQALSTFPGVERRFSYRGLYHGAEIFDDYGHHPTEIQCTLATARLRAKNRLIVIFQPHRYSRTKHLWAEFMKMFAQASIDYLIITDIYPACEAPVPGITSEQFVKNFMQRYPLFPIEYVPYQRDFQSLFSSLNLIVCPADLVLILGAGSINKFAEYLVSLPKVDNKSEAIL